MQSRRLYFSASDPNCYITYKEARCIAWLFQLRTAQEIAEILGLSRRTVEGYIENAKIRLNCHSRAQLYDALRAFNFDPMLFLS